MQAGLAKSGGRTTPLKSNAQTVLESDGPWDSKACIRYPDEPYRRGALLDRGCSLQDGSLAIGLIAAHKIITP